MKAPRRAVVRALLILFAAALVAVAAMGAAPLVNINTADLEQLDTLPGIGPAKARAIVAYREEHGPFETVDDLENVSGIGPKTMEKLRPLVTV